LPTPTCAVRNSASSANIAIALSTSRRFIAAINAFTRATNSDCGAACAGAAAVAGAAVGATAVGAGGTAVGAACGIGDDIATHPATNKIQTVMQTTSSLMASSFSGI
jgi:hypothetical protein